MTDEYEDNCTSKREVQRFKDGRISLLDDVCSGRSSAVTCCC